MGTIAPGEAVQLIATLELLVAGTETLVGGSSVATDAVVLPVPLAGQWAAAGTAPSRVATMRTTTAKAADRTSGLNQTSSRRSRGEASGELATVGTGTFQKVGLAAVRRTSSPSGYAAE